VGKVAGGGKNRSRPKISLDEEKLKRNRILVQRPKTRGRKSASADKPCLHQKPGTPEWEIEKKLGSSGGNRSRMGGRRKSIGRRQALRLKRKPNTGGGGMKKKQQKQMPKNEGAYRHEIFGGQNENGGRRDPQIQQHQNKMVKNAKHRQDPKNKFSIEMQTIFTQNIEVTGLPCCFNY
jgi:hypothetical protein